MRSSASLLNLPAQDAIIGHLTQVRNLHEISDYAPPWGVGFEKSLASHLFQEQIIHFSFSCYVSALEYNLPSASDEAGGRNIVVDRTPLKLNVGFTPHVDPRRNSFVSETMGKTNVFHLVA